MATHTELLKNSLAAALSLLLAAAPALAQDEAKQLLRRRIAEIKESIAANQAQLRPYAWTETTEVSLKGEVKKREQKECKYGPDGKVVKTPLGGGGSQGQGGGKKRGLKGRIVENKVEEMKEYMDRVGSLIQRYLPPNPESMQAAFRSGKVSINPTGALTFADYAKPGDNMTLTFDRASKKLRNLAISTYLDSPEDKVTLTANFSSLPDGANFLEETLLNATAKQIQVKTTNFDHHR